MMTHKNKNCDGLKRTILLGIHRARVRRSDHVACLEGDGEEGIVDFWEVRRRWGHGYGVGGSR